MPRLLRFAIGLVTYVAMVLIVGLFAALCIWMMLPSDTSFSRVYDFTVLGLNIVTLWAAALWAYINLKDLAETFLARVLSRGGNDIKTKGAHNE